MHRWMRRTVASASLVLAAAAGTGATAGAAQASGTEHLTLIYRSRNGTDLPTKVAAAGPISGGGVETQMVDEDSEDGEIGSFTLILRKGTVTGTFVETGFRLNYDPTSCTASPTSSGTFELTGGTGEFVGARGTLAFRTHGTIVAQRGPGGQCFGPETHIEPAVVDVLIEAVGPVQVGS